VVIRLERLDTVFLTAQHRRTRGKEAYFDKLKAELVGCHEIYIISASPKRRRSLQFVDGVPENATGGNICDLPAWTKAPARAVTNSGLTILLTNPARNPYFSASLVVLAKKRQ